MSYSEIRLLRGRFREVVNALPSEYPRNAATTLTEFANGVREDHQESQDQTVLRIVDACEAVADEIGAALRDPELKVKGQGARDTLDKRVCSTLIGKLREWGKMAFWEGPVFNAATASWIAFSRRETLLEQTPIDHRVPRRMHLGHSEAGGVMKRVAVIVENATSRVEGGAGRLRNSERSWLAIVAGAMVADQVPQGVDTVTDGSGATVSAKTAREWGTVKGLLVMAGNNGNVTPSLADAVGRLNTGLVQEANRSAGPEGLS